MRVLLVNPPRSPVNRVRQHAPEAVRPHVHQKLIGPPLGLAALAGHLRDFDVEILDLKAEEDLRPGRDSAGLLDRAVERFRPRVVGVTVMASEWPAARALLARVRELDGGAVTAVGGVHPTLVPGDCLVPEVDWVFLSQAKVTFRRALERLDRDRDLGDVPNLLRRVRGRVEAGPPVDVFREPGWLLDDVHPARDLLARYELAYRVPLDPRPTTYLYTSLGCPGRCTFCSIRPQTGGFFHVRTAESVLRELRTLSEPIVRFADANSLGRPSEAGRLFEAMAREGLGKTLVMDIRPDTAARRPGLVEKAASAGLRVAICGFESDSAEELRGFAKGTRPSDIERAVEVFHGLGVHVRGNYMVQAHFDEGAFGRMAAFADRHPVSFAGFTVATPMPGTPFHRAVAGRIVEPDLSCYNFFNAVLPTRLGEEAFHRRVAELWMHKKGSDVV